MLDFAKIHQQIQKMSEEERAKITDFDEKIDLTLNLFERSNSDFSDFIDKLGKSKPGWLVAEITEPLNTFYELPNLPKNYSVIATDGSQIIPSHHEISLCYLINIGKVTLKYGEQPFAELTNAPTLYYKEEDIYIVDENEEKILVTPEYIGAKRTIGELETLLDLAKNTYKEPTVALADGSLIFWHLEGKNEKLRKDTLAKLIKIFSEFQAKKLPLAGYISGSRSNDVLNALRVFACPKDFANCPKCENQKDQDLVCKKIAGLTDKTLFSKFLKRGQRTSVFGSQSQIINDYAEHKIKFFYMNVGDEIVRVEFPDWIAKDGKALDFLHSACFDQAQKGLGYPVALSEAHEQAVVKGADRELFYKMIEENFVISGKQATITNKALSKRRPLV